MRRVAVRAVLILGVAGPLAVFAAGCGSSDAESGSEEVRASTHLYRYYLEKSAAELVGWVEDLTDQIKAGEFEEAQLSYNAARVPYGQLEPVTESIDDLDRRMDAGQGDVPPNELEGFHRIEKTLWDESATAGLTPVGEQLLADAKELKRKVKTTELVAKQVAQSAHETLVAINASEILGKEDPYSDIDLLDAAANFEGAEAAFEAVKPLLADQDPELTADVEAKFETAYKALRNFGIPSQGPDNEQPGAPGTTFVLYDERSDVEHRELAQAFAPLEQVLAEVPAQLPAEQERPRR